MSEAGNGLKSILASLVKPTKKAKAIMDEYGISLTDAEGNAVPLIEVVSNMREKFGELNETQQAEVATTLFGKEQMSKFLAIINGGDESFNNLKDAIANCDGTTAQMRETMEATASGGIKELLSKLEEMAIQVGTKLLPHVVTLIEKIGKVVDWFNTLDDSTQDLIINIGLFSVVLSPITGMLSKLTSGFSGLVKHMGIVASKSVNAGEAIVTVGESVATTTTAIGGSGGLVASLGALVTTLGAIGTGVAVAGAVVALVGLGYGIYNVYQESKNAADKVDSSTKRMSEAHDLLAQNVTTKYKEIEKSMSEFRNTGLTDLTVAFKDAKNGAELDLTDFKNMCDTKLKEAQTSITTNAKELTNGLEFLNTGIATIFSAEDLGNIQNEWSREMNENLQSAYDGLMTTINEKDSIIEGLMKEHGVDYETAYSEWENNVLEQYGIYCDELIKAQTGYQEESLGSLKEFLQKQTIAEAGGTTNAITKLREQHAEKIKEIESGYELSLAAIAQGETQINGIYFDSAQEAMDYADLVRDYKIAQQQITGEEEIKALATVSLKEGDITEERYNQIVSASDKKISALQAEASAMESIMTSADENVSGVWNDIWKAIDQAESVGIPKSITRNQEFINTLSGCFASGANMSDALVIAYDKVTGASTQTSESVKINFANMDSGTQASLNNVITYMNNLGYSMEDAVKEVNNMQGSTKISVDEVQAYFRQLATNSGQSLDITNKNLENAGNSAYSMRDNIADATNGTSTNIRNMSGNLTSDLINIQDEFGITGNDAISMGGNIESGTNKAKGAGNIMMTALASALGLTGANFTNAGRTVSTETGNMKRNINSVKGKEVNVTANFKESGFNSLWNKITNLISSPKTFSFSSVFTKSEKDSNQPTINFGDNYQSDDIYGMKDAGIKTISLTAFADEGISAYATKDSTASNYVSNAVSNYNQSVVRTSDYSLDKLMKQMTNNQPPVQEIHMFENSQVVLNGYEDVEQLMKEINFYLKTHKQRY